MKKMNKEKETNYTIIAMCSCGNILAANSLRIGDEIDSSFIDTMQYVSRKGGKIKIKNALDAPITISKCKYKNTNLNHHD